MAAMIRGGPGRHHQAGRRRESSTPPTPACWAAAAWTARSIARPGASCWRPCRKIGGCPTGDARITPGFPAAARHVIHTVGPVWGGGTRGEPALLRAATSSSLAPRRRARRFRSIAFPVDQHRRYRFPIDRAARIAVDDRPRTSRRASRVRLKLVRFVCFSAADLAVYEQLLVGLTSAGARRITWAAAPSCRRGTRGSTPCPSLTWPQIRQEKRGGSPLCSRLGCSRALRSSSACCLRLDRVDQLGRGSG
jgi:O-acetyl-ADP-ribose deacetylase (regulator of RNase III)